MIFLTGCFASRRSGVDREYVAGMKGGSVAYEDLIKENITKGGVYIRKFRLESNIGSNRDRFTGNLRVSSTGQWLISLRSFAGIEVARLFADETGITVLDRIGRSATVLLWEKLRVEYGISYDVLPVILGDIPEIGRLRKRFDCDSGGTVEYSHGSLLIRPDCGFGKVANMILTDKSSRHSLSVSSDDYRVNSEAVVPMIIELVANDGLYSVKLNIENIETPWKGIISFEIPSNYRILR